MSNLNLLLNVVSQPYSVIKRTVRQHPYCAAGIALAGIALYSVFTRRFAQSAAFDVESHARQLRNNNYFSLNSISCQSMVKLLTYLRNDPESPHRSVLREKDFESAIYTWIGSTNGSRQDMENIVKKFYNEEFLDERKPIKWIDKIIDKKYEELSILELQNALNYAVFYNKTSILHSLDFDIEQTLIKLREVINTKDIDNLRLEQIKSHLAELIDCIQKLQSPSTPGQIDDLHQRWRLLKATWKADSIEKFECLTPICSRMVDNILHRDQTYVGKFRESIRQKIMTIHAMEIRAMLQNTHYTLIHGESTECWVYQAFFKKFKKLAGQNTRMFHYLRFSDAPEGRTAQQWVNTENVNDLNELERAHLIAADAFFLNENTNESCYDFIKCNKSKFKEAPTKSLDNYLMKIGFNEDRTKQILSELSSLSREVGRSSECGNMYVIAIPIRDAKKMFYASHSLGVPFGKPIDIGSVKSIRFANTDRPADIRKITTAAQRESYADGLPRADQYRVAANLLSPRDHQIFLLSGINNKARFKERVNQIATRAWTSFYA